MSLWLPLAEVEVGRTDDNGSLETAVLSDGAIEWNEEEVAKVGALLCMVVEIGLGCADRSCPT